MADAHQAAVLLNIYSLAIGFVAAGTLASSFAMITGKPLKFELPPEQSHFHNITGAMCRIIAGPFMIMRSMIYSIILQKSEPYWIVVAIVFASLWSFCQGVLILESLCQLGACT